MPRNRTMGRAANGAGSIRKATKTINGVKYNYWQARYTDPQTGKQRAVTGSTQKEVQVKLTEILNDINYGCYVAPSDKTLGIWLDDWLDLFVAHTVKPYTEASYRGYVKNHIKPAIGNIKLSQLNTLQIQRFYNSLLEKGLSPKTIKNINGALHKAIQEAIASGEMKNNPTEACRLPKIRKKEIKPLESDEIRRFLEACKGADFENIYVVTLFTGLRQGEVLGLTWDCVDFEQNALYINKQLIKDKKVGGKYVLDETKNSRSRYIVVAPYVMSVLKKQKAQQELLEAAAGSNWNNERNLVFTDEFGGNLKHINVYKHFKRIVCDLGLDSARFHDLRHSYAVAAIESGDDIKTVQFNLGHATSSFTLDVYGHASQRMKQQSADRMEKYIASVTG